MEKSKTWIERERDFALRSWTPQSCWDGSSLRGDLWILSNPNQNPRVTEIDKLILWLIQKAEGSKRATTMWKTRDTCGGLTLIVIERQEWRFCGTGKGKEQRPANHSNRAFTHTHTHTHTRSQLIFDKGATAFNIEQLALSIHGFEAGDYSFLK